MLTYFLPEVFILLLIVIIVKLWDVIVDFLRRFQKPLHIDSSILLTYYTEKASIIHLAAGMIDNKISYSAMFIRQKQNIAKPNRAYTAYFVNLPFTSKVRLLAIPTKEYAKLNPALFDSMMDEVTLEGDFRNYFTLYANDDQQTQSRYVLDPKAMGFVIDFCKSYNWELINNQLIVITDELVSHDLLIKFIDEIRPAVELRPEYLNRNVDPNYYIPFGFKKRKAEKLLKCPLCKTKTIHIKGEYYSCPHNHGHIMTAEELIKLPKNNNLVTSKDTMHTVVCPNCNKEMIKVNYGKGLVIIDTCLNCPFRWVDEGELVKK